MSKLDKATKERLERARKQRSSYETGWAICDAYYHGRQNVVRTIDDPRKIIELPARQQQGSSGELVYRKVTNRILPVISTLVAKYNSRIPGWAVQPDSGDPVAINNARSSEHALISEYDRLGLARRFTDVLTLAANQGEGYIYVYWDEKAGAPLGDDVFEGAVGIAVLPPQSVIWEQGLRYEESPWVGVDRGLPKDEVEKRYGVQNPRPDALNVGSHVDNVLISGEREANMVTVTEYLERPSAQNPQGRKLIIIGEDVVKEMPYPYDAKDFNELIDQNWLVRYSYFSSPSRDRDMGVTEHLLDAQNAWNVTENQIAKLKDLRANRPIISLKGSYTGPGNMVPGRKYEYNDPEGKPEFLEVPDIGQDVFNYLDILKENFENISGQHAVSGGQAPSNVDTASGLQTLVAQDDSQRAAILKNLAQSHAKLGLEILLLLRRYATEKRLMQFTGKSGHDGAMMFRGSNQVPKKYLCVRVAPGSIEMRTREQISTMVMAYADRGWIDPRVAMSAVEAGTAENILDQFDLDVQWQQREDRRMAGLQEGDLQAIEQALQAEAEIKASYEEAKLQQQQLEASGMPAPPVPPPPPAGPWPHAREFDNHQVHMDTMNLYRKTEEFDLLPEPIKAVFQSHHEEHESFKAQADQRAYEAQQAQAIEQGQQNAARPTRERGKPSAPAPSIQSQGQTQPRPAQ